MRRLFPLSRLLLALFLGASLQAGISEGFCQVLSAALCLLEGRFLLNNLLPHLRGGFLPYGNLFGERF